jgi:beta-glucosidase
MNLFRSSSSRPAGLRLRGIAAVAGFVMLPAAMAITGCSASADGAGSATRAALAGGAASGSRAASAAEAACPWLNRSLPVGRRVRMLMSRMTLADKINEVTGAGVSEPYVFYISAIPSLCIPAIGEEDGPVGVGDGLTGVTELPAAVSLAATWDPALATRYGQVAGAEERAKGAMVSLGPTINIDRDPRWGRSFEAYTEDPYLNASLAVAEIGGVQSQHEMSQVKHFAMYNQETNRNLPADDAIVSERAIHEIYLPGFWAATKVARASSVMCSYSTVNGVPACQNQYLIGDTLDRRWGFPGFVTSDYAATHSTAASADAGLDQEMPAAVYYGPALEAAIRAHKVGVATLDQMVSRILTEMFRFNEFNDPPAGTTGAAATTPAHQAVSTAVAEAGTVLLKNGGHTLPLAASGGGKIAVIGPAASASPTDTGGGSAYVTAPFNVTPLQGIEQAAARPGTSVSYTQGLPGDTSLSPITSPALTPAYAPTGYGGTYAGTLTAPQTGTYVLGFQNPGSYKVTNLSLNGHDILANPGTPPVSTYSVGVHLVAGRKYALRLGGAGESARLGWATPSQLAPGIAQAVAAARAARTAVVVVSDDTESEAADRASLNLPSAQDELISAVAAVNPRTVVVIDAGAPVAMPWLGRVASVVDAWYPGESNGTALAAVLFGQVDPGGHLPVTFPASLSQVPAATPAQFPGADGRVLYSEGIDVGYRYYDAKNETPLFPFGYGLSYTHFGYSGLRVTPGRARNRMVVSARVTNTGGVTGSDVAQLYLGDPAAATEPPRQLKGFSKVTLRPGQSATVRFVLNGHDLSYWDDAANGWVLPDGRFRVYVGDSSALASLPLRGGFTVTRSVGARYVSLQAPSAMGAGSSATVTATVVNDGDYAMPGARFTLGVPAGWTATRVGRLPAAVAPHRAVTARFRVAVPVTAQPTAAGLTARVGCRAGPHGGRGGVAEATATITIPAFTPAAGLAEGWPAG